ncbi:DNA cytosine methyltransferase [Stenotrophomonas rhizophila]|uniref:DNA cytosine methyltransferase n=1 Tax=Stenotrophomonas rhizophila TaxID=216778 RepID=UPI001E3F4ED4|nr:DNA cytosine methyltransferase [Stenotrophomonas rhizophila]MCC7635764.1 DNA cytosine methyltransferase [Stenotrophomonas rhizophila]MCC7664973.1 DNA cytosine methyltransferase [Stenotrophomonas rhizophila]
MNKKVVVDLFAGAGGFSCGFEMAGATAALAVESDRWACDTYEHNHPGTKVLCEDVTALEASKLVQAVEGKKVDLVIGGPPCQGFSIANRNGGDPKDPRNSLFMDFVRLGSALDPSVMIIENVPNLVKARTSSGELVIDVIKKTMEALGYYFYSNILLATDYGVPQIRRRLFCVASKRELDNPFPIPTHCVGVSENQLFSLPGQGLKLCPNLWDAISDLPVLAAAEGGEDQPYVLPAENAYQEWARDGSERIYNHKAMAHGKRMVERFASMKWGDSVNDVPHHLKPRRRNSSEINSTAYDQNNRRMPPHSPCNTVPASFYANFVHPFQNRNFTAREGARIQSFPDTYRFFGKPTVVSHKLLGREDRKEDIFLCQYNQVGNAVPPLMAEAVARNILNQI